MGKLRKRRPKRRRVGRVSIYVHHGRWWVYYRQHGRPIRRPVADDEATAEQVAAQVNLELTASAPTLFSFRPISISELQRTFVDYHEHVVRSSLATVSRYRTATQHLVEFCESEPRSRPVHEVDVEGFVRYLRSIRVAPNGHANSKRRSLRDKGVRFILEICRSMFNYAAKRRHLPPYTENPFSTIKISRNRDEDAKPIYVFTEDAACQFLRAADRWSFGVHFILATTGLRIGELIHLLVEDIDLEDGWLFVRNRPELDARIKTRRERAIPIVAETAYVIRAMIGARNSGPVVLRQKASLAGVSSTNFDSSTLDACVAERVKAAESLAPAGLSRRDVVRIQRSVWRGAGATVADRVRVSYIRTAIAAGMDCGTCPKSWRHSFATLLQDANVDPLIRQETLGHAPSSDFASGALRMTARYTHTRRSTQQREIERALRLWPQMLSLANEFTNER
jgi:integrase